MSSPDDRKIKIKVPESYKKIDDSVWEDLEQYLYLGFLHNSASLLNKSFVFKTLNHNEIRNIGFLRNFRASPLESKNRFRSAFIAHSVFMIDGENILYQRPRHINRIIRIISKLSGAIQDSLIENLGSLNSRANRLYPLTEIYVHENRSRYRWMHIQNMQIHSPLSTGLPGTEELGMNYCQQTWVTINKLLDRRDEAEREWSNAKFIGSCFNGKAVRGIDEKDRGRKERDISELEEKKMKVLYNYLNRVSGDTDLGPSEVTLPDNRIASVVGRYQAISAEELADQLSATLSGEKDHHDRVVELQEKKLIERARTLSDYQRQIHTSPIIPLMDDQPSGFRVLGSKEKADDYLALMERARRDQYERLNRQIQTDLLKSNNDPDHSDDMK